MLEAKNITVNYGARAAVADVSLLPKPGEVIAIIGPNGAGKSTFLRALNGSLPVASGQVLLDGNPLGTFARRAVARHIAVVAQESDLRFPVTVMEFVLCGRHAWTTAWGWETERDVDIARAVMHDTALEDFAARFLTSLSA